MCIIVADPNSPSMTIQFSVCALRTATMSERTRLLHVYCFSSLHDDNASLHPTNCYTSELGVKNKTWRAAVCDYAARSGRVLLKLPNVSLHKVYKQPKNPVCI
jgi:hypothetical protein